MKHGLLNPAFRYTKSGDTDIRKLFQRIRREQKETAEAKAPLNVKQLRKGTK